VRKVLIAQHLARLPSKRKIKEKDTQQDISTSKICLYDRTTTYIMKNEKNIHFRQTTTHIMSYVFEYSYETTKDGIRILSGPFKLEMKTIPEKESCTYAG
jgi:hypothetical protein